MTNDSLGQAKALGSLAAAFLDHSYTSVLAPLWKIFPDLEPPKMKQTWIDPKPVLGLASQQALRAFLDQAHAVLRMVEETLPPGECDARLAFGDLSEMRSATAEIERFLAPPRPRRC